MSTFNLFVTQPELEDRLKAFLPNYSSNDSWYFDTMYRAIHTREFTEVFNQWLSYHQGKLVYLPEVFDCDDFAFCFSALARLNYYSGVGMVVGELWKDGEFLGYHAWNIIMMYRWTEDKPEPWIKLYEFEPQTLDLFDTHKSHDGFDYKGEWVIW